MPLLDAFKREEYKKEGVIDEINMELKRIAQLGYHHRDARVLYFGWWKGQNMRLNCMVLFDWDSYEVFDKSDHELVKGAYGKMVQILMTDIIWMENCCNQQEEYILI